MTRALAGILIAIGMVMVGCGKKAPPPTAEISGVTVDLPKLNEAFVSAAPELRTTATQVGFNIRYGKYEEALMALDKLLNDPGATDAQKKVVTTVIEQVKKLAGAAPGAAPAQ